MVSSGSTHCIEKKILLSGAVHEYPCHLIHFSDGFGILHYVIDREYVVGGIPLHVGEITYALYWADRPYTLYSWRLKRLDGALYYFNIADSISLAPREFLWRDLAVDILVDPQKAVRVLDEHELPQNLPRELREYIRGAQAYLLGHYLEIIREADVLLNRFIK